MAPGGTSGIRFLDEVVIEEFLNGSTSIPTRYLEPEEIWVEILVDEHGSIPPIPVQEELIPFFSQVQLAPESNTAELAYLELAEKVGGRRYG